MQVEEALIQPFHLGAVRASIMALLAVTGLLVLALAHDLGCLRTEVQEVRCRANEIERKGQQHRYAVCRVEHASQGSRYSRYSRTFGRKGESQEDR